MSAEKLKSLSAFSISLSLHLPISLFPLSPPLSPPPSPSPSSRYVRREKEIADTKRELAESENVRHRQLADHLKTQLTEAKEQFVEVTEAAKAQSETVAQHAEILAKVHTLDTSLQGLHKEMKSSKKGLSA